MHTELRDLRRNWAGRILLANAMLMRIELFYSRQRRHSTLDDEAPVNGQ